MLKQKFYGVDLLRVIACLAVCLFHFCNLKFTESQTYLQADSLLLKFSNIIWYLVFSFFIISSYILFFSLSNQAYTINQFGRYISKRLLRIYPPFFFSIIIFIFIQYLFTVNPNYEGIPFQIEWTKLITNLLLCPSLFGEAWYNPIYWTLAMEFQFYFILGIIFPIFNSSRFSNSLIFELIALGVFFFTIYLDLSFFQTNKQTIISYWDLFYLGFILFRYKSNKISLSKALILLVVLLLGIFIHYYNSEHYLIFYVCVISILVILYIKHQPDIVLKMSNISYSFYLTHGFTGGLFLYFTREFFTDPEARFQAVLIAVVVSIIGALPFYKFIEKPWQKVSHKLRLNSLDNPPK